MNCEQAYDLKVLLLISFYFIIIIQNNMRNLYKREEQFMWINDASYINMSELIIEIKEV